MDGTIVSRNPTQSMDHTEADYMTVEATTPNALATAIQQTVEELSAAPEGATTLVFRADTRLLHRVLTEARIRQFTLRVDEPPSLGGADEGPNPVELVLAALGTCQEIVYAAYAAVLGIRLDGLEIEVRGPLDPRGFLGIAPVPSGFERVELHTRITSPEEPDRIRQLVETVQTHCPVLDIVQRPLEVRNQVELNLTTLA